MTYSELCLKLFVYMTAFSAISLVAGSPDPFVVQVGDFVAQAEFLPMNVTQYFGKRLFARQVCAI